MHLINNDSYVFKIQQSSIFLHLYQPLVTAFNLLLSGCGSIGIFHFVPFADRHIRINRINLPRHLIVRCDHVSPLVLLFTIVVMISLKLSFTIYTRA